MYKVSIECPELSKTYGEGDGIGLVNNTATGKMWIHSNFTIRESDNNIELLRRLIEYILNNIQSTEANEYITEIKENEMITNLEDENGNIITATVTENGKIIWSDDNK